MNNFRSVGITLLALSMGFGGLASAQNRDRDRGSSDHNNRQTERRGPPDRNDRNHGNHGNQRNDNSSRWDNRDHRGGPRHRADHDGGRGNQSYSQRGGAHGQHGNQGYNQRGEFRDHRGDWRGAGPSHNLRRGGYLTPQYRSRQYVVENWRGHHLNAPPRGYHWVQTGGDYVLAAIATGLILQILLNN